MNFNQFLNEAAFANKAETKKIAETLAKAISKHDGCKCTVNMKSLEDSSFDLDVDGEEYDGGSYYINDKGEVVNAAVTPHEVYGTTKSTVEDFIKGLNKPVKESVVNERNVTLKRQYTENHPAIVVGKAAKIRNKVLEAIKDGKISQDEFDNLLKEMTTDSKRWLKRNSHYFNVSEDGISLSKSGSKLLKNIMVSEATTKAPKVWVPGGFDKEISKYPNSKITRKIVLDAAVKWEVDPEDAIKYVEYGWVVDLDENKQNNDMKTKFIYESFSEFVENRLNENSLNEAFKSLKLSTLFNVDKSGSRDLAGAFYNFSKLAIDKIEDYDIIEMDPQTARKEKRANAIYFYIVTSEKVNPYIAGSTPSRWNNGIIPSNTLLAITNGNNEWYSTGYNRYSKVETLSKSDSRESSAGFDKRDSKRYDGSGITSITKVAELADVAYVIDLDVLKARYSTTELLRARQEAKSGATAFKSDKDFKAENMSRYNLILSERAVELPIKDEVSAAIEKMSKQIADAIAAGETDKYGQIIVGTSPKGSPAKLSDCAYHMKSLLDAFQTYATDVENAEKEKQSGYDGKYYIQRIKNDAKNVADKIKQIDTFSYVW